MDLIVSLVSNLVNTYFHILFIFVALSRNKHVLLFVLAIGKLGCSHSLTCFWANKKTAYAAAFVLLTYQLKYGLW
jgi:hypothetical protein